MDSHPPITRRDFLRFATAAAGAVVAPHAAGASGAVPHLTQPPIKPSGGRFVYEFPVDDAGTFWYHPHLGSPEQVCRGLYGALIVEEARPPAVDRDVVWMLGDWRLDRSARIVEDFRNFMDASHAGCIGKTVTVNGKVTESFELRSGERIRLRLVNAANARTGKSQRAVAQARAQSGGRARSW